MMHDFKTLLGGGDLRSLGKSSQVIKLVKNQRTFDKLFNYLFDSERIIVLRCADAVEKISLENPAYLTNHKNALIKLLFEAENKELKWHLAQLISRLKLTKNEIGKVWQVLYSWVSDKKESRIVRVHSLQAMYDLLKQYPALRTDFDQLIEEVSKQSIPSITARIKQFK